MTAKIEPNRKSAHGHLWVVGLLGMIAGLVLLVYVPRLPVIANSLFLLAGFHLIGAVVLVTSSLYAARSRRQGAGNSYALKAHTDYDFGWGPAWVNGLAIAALVALAGAVALQVVAPAFWPLAFALVAQAAVCVVGIIIWRGFLGQDQILLPMVALLSGDNDLVLDAGCGSGRTTIALGKALGSGRVVAFDRFDAGYIGGGGRTLITHNLKVAALSDRVSVQTGDLTAMPFADNHFDAAVSTHVYDHLGTGKSAALAETLRVLKPGGRFLMAVWVPGWTMFAVGNVFSFFLTSRTKWRKMAAQVGFELCEEGVFNNVWFVLLAKPAVPTTLAA